MSNKLLKKVVEQVLKNDEKKVLYTALVVNTADASNLRQKIDSLGLNPDSWLSTNISRAHGNEQLSHHMTINIGKLKSGDALAQRLGEVVSMTVIGFGYDAELGVAAWKVEPPAGISAKSGVPHVTALLRDESVKPFKAAKIKEWKSIEPFNIKSSIVEVTPR